jgi:tetratricopeptide (TPR) repeat protein
MDTNKYLDEIERLWPQNGQSSSKEIVDLCLAAVAEHPESSTLWYDLGVIMERCDEDYRFTAEDFLHCFEKAIECNSNNWKAHEELGYVLDVYFSDYARAEKAFEKAITLGAKHESYFGRARVLAQAGKDEAAIKSLSEDICPFHDQPDIQKLRSEILDGSWFSKSASI